MAAESLEARLIAIASDLQIESDVEFRFAKHLFNVNEPRWALPSQPYVAPRERLTHAVSLALYYGAYCRGHQDKIHVVPEDLVPDHAFVESLSAANQTQRTVERGWKLVHREADGNTLHVSKAGRYRTATVGQYQQTPVTGPGSYSDDLYSLPVHREERHWLPMFYLAHSETLPNQSDDSDSVRFYFHCDQHSVLQVMRSLTTHLNRYYVPFRIKCLDHPRLFGRSDALVLYLEKRYVHFVVNYLLSSAEVAAFQLFDGVPLFSKQLLKGIGIAEDPGDRQSFGQHRCRLLADALIDAHDAHCLHDESVLGPIEKRFRQAGLDLCRPHVNQGAVDWYAFPGQQGVVA